MLQHLDQAAPAHQGILRYLRERGKDAISRYVLVAIVKKQLQVDRSLSEILQILTAPLETTVPRRLPPSRVAGGGDPAAATLPGAVSCH